MNSISCLDCTLRDGGYCNNWEFGKQNIQKIVEELVNSKVDIIECGFLVNKISYDNNVSKYNHVSQIETILPSGVSSCLFVAMINYGEYDISLLPNCKQTKLDGIRVAFHKKNYKEAIQLCGEIDRKGYLVFLQPMVSMLYIDSEFEDLVREANQLHPYAFYIVDSFGTMDQQDILRYFTIADTILLDDISIGFHSHNNLQLAYANSIFFSNQLTTHNLIVDCSVYGMGRGAGNLNSELFLARINKMQEHRYNVQSVLQIMDSIINRFYEEKPWGYSLPNYLSAIYMIHPNYAIYLNEKHSLRVEEIDGIFSMMEEVKKYEYDRKYIEDLYIKYMSFAQIESKSFDILKKELDKRPLLLLGPGKSVFNEKEKISEFIDLKNPLVVSINYESSLYKTDYIFVSNIKRYYELNEIIYKKVICTSNIRSAKAFMIVDFDVLLNDIDYVKDNAALMAIKFFTKYIGAQKVFLAGIDGYSHNIYANFEDKDMVFVASSTYFDDLNAGMKKVLNSFLKDEIKIFFLTKSILENEENNNI